MVIASGPAPGGSAPLPAEECPSLTPVDFAHSAGLHYVSEGEPGIRRLRAGRGFRYLDAGGAPIRDARAIERFKALAIPPAWTEVWICPSPRGHIQATGRDERGRKQYRYHADWRRVRDEAKYNRTREFGQALSGLRRRLEGDMARPGLPKEKVVAAIVRILDEGLIRVGNEEYARENGSYGLTTLKPEHADIRGGTIRFRFRGKSGKDHEVAINDRRVARIIHRCQELPSQELFQYLDDDGVCRSVGSTDVNDYLHEAMGTQFTAKDFRTWGGSVAALEAFVSAGPATSAADSKHQIVQAVKAAAARLANTPAVCKACYVHPDVIAAYLDGSLFRLLDRSGERPEAERAATADTDRLSSSERLLLDILESR